MPTSPPPLKSNYNQNSLSALFDDNSDNLKSNTGKSSPYREPRSRLRQNPNKQRRTLSASPSNKADLSLKNNQKSSVFVSESAPPPKHTERMNENENENENMKIEEKSMSVTEENAIPNIKGIPLIPNMMIRSTADPDQNEKKQASPIKNTNTDHSIKDDVIRLNHRGFCVDLSHKNAELVPLGISNF